MKIGEEWGIFCLIQSAKRRAMPIEIERSKGKQGSQLLGMAISVETAATSERSVKAVGDLESVDDDAQEEEEKSWEPRWGCNPLHCGGTRSHSSHLGSTAGRRMCITPRYWRLEGGCDGAR